MIPEHRRPELSIRCGTEGNISYSSNNDDDGSGRWNAQVLSSAVCTFSLVCRGIEIAARMGKSSEVGHRFPHHGTASGATSDKNVMPGPLMKPRISRHELPSLLATMEDAVV